MPAPTISPFILGDYQTNCHVVTPSRSGGTEAASTCWIVDCGFEPDELLDWIAASNLSPAAIVLTHAHVDHIAGVDQALSRFGPLPLYIHEAEAGFCSDPLLNLSALTGLSITCTEPSRYLKHGDVLTLGPDRWRVLHTPGHSPGGICLVHDESNQAIVGDTLFAGSIGRFDFPTSDADALRRSLHGVIMALPDQTVVYPGHGPKTTIGRERRSNPYIVGGF